VGFADLGLKKILVLLLIIGFWFWDGFVLLSLVQGLKVNGRSGGPGVLYQTASAAISMVPQVVAHTNGAVCCRDVEVASAGAALGQGEALEHLDAWIRVRCEGAKGGLGYGKGCAVALGHSACRLCTDASVEARCFLLLMACIHKAHHAPAAGHLRVAADRSLLIGAHAAGCHKQANHCAAKAGHGCRLRNQAAAVQPVGAPDVRRHAGGVSTRGQVTGPVGAGLLQKDFAAGSAGCNPGAVGLVAHRPGLHRGLVAGPHLGLVVGAEQLSLRGWCPGGNRLAGLGRRRGKGCPALWTRCIAFGPGQAAGQAHAVATAGLC